VVALLSLTGTARATLVRALDLAGLCAHSALIVEGRVEEAETVRRPAGPGVFSDYRVRVERVHKGASRPTQVVTLRLPGGRLQGARVKVDGVPALGPGQRALLFLEPLPAGAFPDEGRLWIPVGLEQGVVFLRATADGEVAERRSFGARLLSPPTRLGFGGRSLPSDAGELRRTLTDALRRAAR